MTFAQSLRRGAALVAATMVATVSLSALPAGAGGNGALDGLSAKQAKAAAQTYAEVVEASYASSVESATAMKTAIDAFLASPTPETLEAAKQAWLTARDDYAPTEAFRFYNGPIDNPKTGLEGQINAWPLDEAYIDGVEGDPGSGIINDADTFPEITADVLVEANEQGGETNISTGWHAVEFLLWGQDTTTGQAGQRPVTDYTTSPTSDRRAAYLSAATDLLVEDLTTVNEAWAPDAKYRKQFVKNPTKAVTSILRGIGALSAGELAGERMAVGYETKDQEDEHSCFSDNTNADIIGDQIGIERVYRGELPDGTVAGTSISDLVAKVDPDLDQELQDQLDATTAAIEAYPAPFEELIVGDDDAPGRVALLASIEALEKEGALIARVAKQLGVRITLAV